MPKTFLKSTDKCELVRPGATCETSAVVSVNGHLCNLSPTWQILLHLAPGRYSLVPMHGLSRRLIFLLLLLLLLISLLLLPIIRAPTPVKNFFHPDCSCHRPDPPTPPPAPPPTTSGPWTPPLGSFVGPSTCNSYTTVLGAGQRVLSYTYYTPWQVFLAKISRPSETVEGSQGQIQPWRSST